MEEQQTCGKGLAEHSALPRAAGALIDALAENLEVHLEALDREDDAARAEHDAYTSLAARHRAIAGALRSASDEMSGYRDLPMAPHDMAVMTSPRVGEAFARLVAAERELAAVLETSIRRHEAMLAGD
jgi:hypothetical protein